ncbi:glycosyltransferase [Enterovirga sp.]|uniref:glycosyltransferase n=1 Tax=Enterovirga sp. TaxID=2026350 RepID=UPI002C47B403|nr:glycosyltransferase [Enterovirga sp.]HMO29327.1 glycosyltransferase [Enterovirga sp.]
MSLILDTSRPEARPRAITAIPVRDEAERIGACLEALGAQAGIAPGSSAVVLLVNNSSDGTIEVVRELAPRLAVPLRMVERNSPDANAGWARRGAMDAAADWLEEVGATDGVILTTDADSRVPPNWIALNLAAIAAGADGVAGQIALDEADEARLPASLRERGLLEETYERLLTELSARIDPERHDPWPTHWSQSGASLAVTLAAYRRVDGMPAIALGDDRAFVSRLKAADLIVRHTPEIVVATSGRLEGRAKGGVADTMRVRCEEPDCACDGRLEPLSRALYRYRWHRRLRLLGAQGQLGDTVLWAQPLEISPAEVEKLLATGRIGEVIEGVDATSPRLRSPTLRPSELPGQIKLAQAAVAAYRLRDRLLPPRGL